MVPPPFAAKVLASLKLRKVLQRLPGILDILLWALCFFGPFYVPGLYLFYYYFINMYFAFSTCRGLYGSLFAWLRSVEHTKTNWREKYHSAVSELVKAGKQQHLPMDSVKHLIIIPQFKEELPTMYETLEVLASHKSAKSQYKV